MSDWWSVGIIMYQLMMLKTPFEEPEFKNENNLNKDAFKKEAGRENNRRICNKPINFDDCRNEKCYSDNIKDVVLKLLNRDQAQRLGQESEGDSLQILAHPAFTAEMKKHVDDLTYDAPIKPEGFNLLQDFETAKHRHKISEGLDCFNDDEKALIKENNHKF